MTRPTYYELTEVCRLAAGFVARKHRLDDGLNLHERLQDICTRIEQPEPVQPENGTCSNKCECSHLNQTCDKTPTNRFRTASGNVVHLCRRCAEHSYGCDGFALTPAQHAGTTITDLQQMVNDRVTLHEAGLPIETRRRYDAYVWQMNDGRWHISECTNARLRGFPALPFGIPGFETEADARAHLRKLEDELNTQH